MFKVFKANQVFFQRPPSFGQQAGRNGASVGPTPGPPARNFCFTRFFGRTTVIIKIKCETHDMYTQILMKKKLN